MNIWILHWLCQKNFPIMKQGIIIILIITNYKTYYYQKTNIAFVQCGCEDISLAALMKNRKLMQNRGYTQGEKFVFKVNCS